jgi:hypothetical protein
VELISGTKPSPKQDNVPPLVSDPQSLRTALCKAFNTDDEKFIEYLLMKVVLSQGKLKDGGETEVNALISVFEDIKPRDALERMLVAQMMMCFGHATRQFRFAANATLTGTEERHLNLASRLIKLYSTQLETLRKYRNEGRQVITVNHVTANQAIVGDVHHGGRG